MISEFRYKNFLSAKEEQCLSFEATSDNFMDEEYCYEVKEGVHLLRMGIIYGANASGKTNILLALSAFRDLLLDVPKDKMEEMDITPFLLNNTSRNEKTEFSLSFYLNQEKHVLSLTLDKKRVYSESLIYYPATQPAKLYERIYNEQTDSTIVNFGNKLGLSKKDQSVIIGNTINNCTVMAAFGKANVALSRLNEVYKFFSKQIADVLHPGSSLSSFIKKSLDEDTENKLKPFLVNFLKASDFNISDIELREEEITITPELEKFIEASPISNEAREQMLQKGKFTSSELMFMHQTDNGEFELSEGVESRGTLRFMGMSVILMQLLQENRIMCVDEIGTSLHYELLSYFLKVFLANSTGTSQLIMTTHDINLLDEDFIRRDCVWFTDKNNSGESLLIRLSSLGLHKNLSPYNAYKQGKLVNLPFFDSIYIKENGVCDHR